MAKKNFKDLPSLIAFLFILVFVATAIYAPLLASNQPLFVFYEGEWFSPLFRYLLYPGFFTKPIDRFFNLLMILSPLTLLLKWIHPRKFIPFFLFILSASFCFIETFPLKNPASRDSIYERLEELISFRSEKEDHEKLVHYLPAYQALLEERQGELLKDPLSILPTAWNIRLKTKEEQIKASRERGDLISIKEIEENWSWLDRESSNLFIVMPLIRPFHYETESRGNQLFNQVVPWYELSRINRKDLTAALIFGTRISIVVGLGTVAIASLIGVPLGGAAGYFGGKFDLVLCRLLEIWEGMPLFFILLIVAALTESKSIGWTVVILSLFGWTSFARFVRSEALRVRPLPYILTLKTFGASERRILFLHILPNSLNSFLTLLPFSIIGAITAESGISFLGLGDEGSSSLGVLMDEGRNHFPAESFLLWPPALLLTILLISTAILGDALQQMLDPKKGSR